MGYGGNGGEYWGLQTNNKYGVSDPGSIGRHGVRTAIIHDYSNGTYGGNTLRFDRESMGVGSNLTTGQMYQLFCIGSQTSSYGCYVKLYRCKAISYSGSLVRDFIPVRRNVDSAIGLYDLVENKFYGNNGSGSFIGHSLNRYIPIEYIESNGNQYIDTGFSAPEGFKFDCAFAYNGITGSYIIGSHNASSPYGRNGVGADSAYWELPPVVIAPMFMPYSSILLLFKCAV